MQAPQRAFSDSECAEKDADDEEEEDCNEECRGVKVDEPYSTSSPISEKVGAVAFKRFAVVWFVEALSRPRVRDARMGEESSSWSPICDLRCRIMRASFISTCVAKRETPNGISISSSEWMSFITDVTAAMIFAGAKEPTTSV